MFFKSLLYMDVIDSNTGRKIGYLVDIRFDNSNGLIESIIVVECRKRLFSRLFSFFHQVEIYRENIVMFGEDVVVVKSF